MYDSRATVAQSTSTTAVGWTGSVGAERRAYAVSGRNVGARPSDAASSDGADADRTINRTSGVKPLSPRQLRTVEALLTEASHECAARKAGVSSRSLRQWLQESGAFRDALRQASRDRLAHAADSLRAATIEAVATLRDLLGDENGAVRCRAAQALLGLAFQCEADDLARRVEALEQKRGAMSPSGRPDVASWQPCDLIRVAKMPAGRALFERLAETHPTPEGREAVKVLLAVADEQLAQRRWYREHTRP